MILCGLVLKPEQHEQSEQLEQLEHHVQFEHFVQSKQYVQFKQLEQSEQFKQLEQSEQFEQYEQLEQSEQFLIVLLFLCADSSVFILALHELLLSSTQRLLINFITVLIFVFHVIADNSKNAIKYGR